MRVKRTIEQLKRYLLDSLKTLESRIEDYDNGKVVAYREIANQLRKLLCDTKKGKPSALLPKLFPIVKLHPLSFQPKEQDLERNGHKLGFFISGPITKENSVVRLPNLLNLNEAPISLDSWLSQCIISPEITLMDLIKSVVEKDGGTHVDEIINEVLMKGEFLRLKNIECKAVYIAEIGRYVLEEIKEMIEGISD